MNDSSTLASKFQILRARGRRKLVLSAVVTLALAVGFSSQPIRTSLGATSQSPDFQDTFDGAAVDTSKWGFDYPWDEASVSTCRRSELQCYEREQATVSNGTLKLTAKPVDASTVPPRRDSSHPYASGLIQSQPSASHQRTGFATTYGYFEMSAKLTNEQATWPAFWLVPTDTSWPPELDIMESLGQDPTRHSCTYHAMNGTAPQGGDRSVDKSQGFHTYAMRWAADGVQCIFDGRVIGTFSNPPAKEMYIILNLAVGGYAGTPNPAQFPATYEVDYVRAWRDPNVVPGSPPSGQPAPASTPTPTPTPAPPPASAPTPTATPQPSSAPSPAPRAPSAACSNLVVNPSFERDASHWSAWHGRLSTARSEAAPDGGSVARVDHVWGGTYSVGQRPEAVASVVAATSYYATAYVAAASSSAIGKPVVLAVRERRSGGSIVAVTESYPVSLRNDFQRLTVPAAMVRRTGDVIDVYVIQFGAQAGDAFYADMIALSSCGARPAQALDATGSVLA